MLKGYTQCNAGDRYQRREVCHFDDVGSEEWHSSEINQTRTVSLGRIVIVSRL